MDSEKDYIALVRFITQALVQNKDDVQVEDSIDERGVLIQVFVDKSDMGRLIGKEGATVKAIRNVLRALGTKNNARYSVKVESIQERQSSNG